MHTTSCTHILCYIFFNTRMSNLQVLQAWWMAQGWSMCWKNGAEPVHVPDWAQRPDLYAGSKADGQSGTGIICSICPGLAVANTCNTHSKLAIGTACSMCLGLAGDTACSICPRPPPHATCSLHLSQLFHAKHMPVLAQHGKHCGPNDRAPLAKSGPWVISLASLLQYKTPAMVFINSAVYLFSFRFLSPQCCWKDKNLILPSVTFTGISFFPSSSLSRGFGPRPFEISGKYLNGINEGWFNSLWIQWELNLIPREGHIYSLTGWIKQNAI